MSLDAYDFARPVRPKPEPTSQERVEAQRRDAFAQESRQAGDYARPSPPESGHLKASAVCVIGDSGHIRAARNCPHGLPKDQADYDQVITVES